MKVIGLDHRTRGLTGSRLVTMGGRFFWVTGRETAVDLNMTTTGTATETGIFITSGTARIGTTTARAGTTGDDHAEATRTPCRRLKNVIRHARIGSRNAIEHVIERKSPHLQDCRVFICGKGKVGGESAKAKEGRP